MPRINRIFLGIMLMASACGSTETPIAVVDTVSTTSVASAPEPIPTHEPPEASDIYSDAQPVEVLIASSDIEAGTAWDEARRHIEVATVPLTIRPATFVSPDNTDVVRGMVARGDIPRNQIIVLELFGDPAVVSVAPTVPASQTVVSLPMPSDLPLVQPGDMLLISLDDQAIWPIRADVLRASDQTLTVRVDDEDAETLAQVEQTSISITVPTPAQQGPVS